jgi:hypothetical protein
MTEERRDPKMLLADVIRRRDELDLETRAESPAPRRARQPRRRSDGRATRVWLGLAGTRSRMRRLRRDDFQAVRRQCLRQRLANLEQFKLRRCVAHRRVDLSLQVIRCEGSARMCSGARNAARVPIKVRYRPMRWRRFSRSPSRILWVRSARMGPTTIAATAIQSNHVGLPTAPES